MRLTAWSASFAISRWLTFGDPSPLRLGNSNKFDCSRLNRGVSWLTQNREFKEVREVKEVSDGTSSESVYSDLGCCRKAVKEKISTKGQACLKPKVDIFYFNNSQSYPKSASARKRNEVYGILPFPPRGSAKPASSLCSRSAASVFQEFFAGVVLIFLAMLFVRCFLEFGAQTLQSHSADYLTKRLCDKN